MFATNCSTLFFTPNDPLVPNHFSYSGHDFKQDLFNLKNHLQKKFIEATISKDCFGRLHSVQDAGGNDVSSAPLVNTSFTFTGREWDQDVELYYYRARYYDPGVGRFL